MRRLVLVLIALAAAPLPLAGSGPAAPPRGEGMARLPAGSYVPLYTRRGEGVRVEAFELDRLPVTQALYLEFVRENPRWRRSRVKPVFAGRSYLSDWRGDLDPGAPDAATRPATGVSWFAARAYCESRGKRLPTLHEWEYAASASESAPDASRDPAFVDRLLSVYGARAGRAPRVGESRPNLYGVYDLHELGWEWVLDFNAVMVSDDSRASGARDHQLYCAGGALGTTDPANYPAFLRYAFRAGLRADFASPSLGFRCARSL